MTWLTLGLVQQDCTTDAEQNRQASATKIKELAAQGAQLVLLQELHAGLYFCQTENTECFEQAEDIEQGASRRFFEALAAELDLTLVVSLFEKRAPGLYHNTALVFDGLAGYKGLYRKMHIPDDPAFYEKFYFTPGDASPKDPLAGFRPIETRHGKLGVLVCWDQWYPEAARLMALAGADLLLYPTAIGWDPNDTAEEKQRQLDAWMLVQRGHAVANGLPVIVANRVGHEASQDPNASGIDFWGNSFVAGPQGELLAWANHQEPCQLLVELDLKRSEEVRRIWPFLRDRRVDAYGNLTERFLP